MEIIVASGPVIIENNKVLLDKEQKEYGITPWFFPGGRLNSPNESPEDACKREVNEELGINIKIIKQLRTLEKVMPDNKKSVLYHFLAERTGEIKIGDDVVEYGWFDINNLPNDCAWNVYEIIAEYKNMV
ncbi:MAG: Phosphohydrolase, MutT/Nudix family protein [Candidatus Magasanikbacteria bacterium GW2011_GWC2_37_14]|uniref:Phosphohydrolase, MutT/Nudix family protein n=1 Tax=Candidatus Magasanikbacteria bacterium GW2011_GWC2_37_14 TaxID=1619046 RepID=A0A0G0IVQ2_9BACT|nr:MAG: Phosphohydrolase, MutT/Nudix family protein [Candidatus Magasanikbacteria bacterium GW2011_GWC2_37_14]